MEMRRWVGALALAALAILAALMAAAGPAVVPAAGRGGDPSWLGGAYGEGFGIAGGDYIHLERASMLTYAVVVFCAAALPARLLWGGIVALVLAFTASGPLLSLDVFSYISYARLEELHGLNPYQALPQAVPDDPALPFVLDNRDVVSAYGPLFTLLSMPLAHLGIAGAVFSLKAIAGLSVLGAAWLVSRMAADRGLDPRPAAALVALNPVVLVHVVGGAHNDALMAFVMTLGVAGILGARELGGGVALVAAAGVKVSAAFVLPFAAVEGLVRDRRLLAGLAAGAVIVIAVALLAFGSAVDAAIALAGANQDRGTRSSVPHALASDLGLDRDDVRAALRGAYLALVVGLLIWVARGFDWVRAAGWAGLGLLIASNYMTPWYVILALPLAAISRDRALVVATIAFSAFLLRYQVPGLGG